MINDNLFDNLVDGIIIVNLSGEFIYWNKTAEKIFNSKFENQEEQNLDLIFTGNNRKLLAKAIKTKTSIQQLIELDGQKVGDGLVPLELSVSKFVENKKKYVTLTFRDVFEKKLRMNIYNFTRDYAFSIKKQETIKSILQLTIESIQKIRLFDSGGVFLFKEFPVMIEEEVHQNEHSENIDLIIESLSIDEIVTKLEKGESIYLDEKSYPDEDLFTDPNPNPVTLFPILDRNKIISIMYFVGEAWSQSGSLQNELINNINIYYVGEIKRIRAQNALIKSESTNRAILDALPDFMLQIEKSGLILNYRGEINNFFNFKKDILRRNISEIYPPDISALISIMILRTIKKKTVQQFEYSIKIDNEVKYFDGRMSYLGDNEIIAIIRDITRIKLTQISLAESKKNLSDLNARKDKFFSILAHDLRSPFIGLLGYAEMLKNEHSVLEREEIRIFSESIYRSSKRIFNLLENLLHWSRLQTNRMDFKPVEFNLATLIDYVITLFNMNFKEKNIKLEKDFLNELFAFADQFMIETTIRNLISNSIKFSFKDGTIKISAIEQDDHIKISVSDNGVGMTKEAIENLFDISKANSTRGTNNEEGTGLGLILCKEFVTKNNGEIWAESELDKGSKFTFTIPCN